MKEKDVSVRDEWLQTVANLKDQIKTWIQAEPGWVMYEAETKAIQERRIGEYTVTVAEIHTPDGKVLLDPIARNFPGSGITELYAWPTAYRARLIQDGNGGWRVLTDSGLYLHQPWDRAHFIQLVQELIGAEEMMATG